MWVSNIKYLVTQSALFEETVPTSLSLTYCFPDKICHAIFFPSFLLLFPPIMVLLCLAVSLERSCFLVFCHAIIWDCFAHGSGKASFIHSDICDTSGGKRKEMHHQDESIKTSLYVCIACGFQHAHDDTPISPQRKPVLFQIHNGRKEAAYHSFSSFPMFTQQSILEPW
jgi:hypothetical protein